MPYAKSIGVPKVSVIVPNYNHARFLRRRLDSIVAQTWCDFEIIILDDASTDDSRQVIVEYLGDVRVRFYPNDTNSGSPFAQWNRGVSLARGEFIWIAESDDVAEPAFLATLVPLLQGNPQLGFAYCQSLTVDSNDRVTGTYEEWTKDLDPQRWQSGFINNGRDECARFLFWKNTVPNASAVLFRRSVFLLAGGPPLGMRLAGDWMTWVRMLLISDVAFVPQHLNHYRYHHDTVRYATSAQKDFDEGWSVQRFIMRSCVIPSSARRALAKRVVNEYITRVRMAGSGKKWGVLIQGYVTFWPVFFTNPLISIGVIFRRGMRIFGFHAI